MRLLRQVIFSLLVAASAAAAATPRAAIDLGWLRATQEANGWRITNVFHSTISGQSLRPGDVVLSIDGESFTDVNALTAAYWFAALPHAHGAVVLRNDVRMKLNFVESAEPLLRNFTPMRFGVRSELRSYVASAAMPKIELADTSGQLHQLSWAPGWTLVHIWSSRCGASQRELETLNELSNPQTDGFSLVIVAMNDDKDSLARFGKDHDVRFASLLGGDWGSRFAFDFDVFSTDLNLVVGPSGRVSFAGEGDESLRAALDFLHQAGATPVEKAGR